MLFLQALLIFFPAIANAEPVQLRVNFSIEICTVQPDGTFCEFNLQPSENVTLDNDGEAPALWVKNQLFSEITFEGSIGLVRYPDGDRLIFRSLVTPAGQERAPAYIALKLRSWKQMEDFIFEPEPYVVGNVIYQPHLNVWPAN